MSLDPSADADRGVLTVSHDRWDASIPAAREVASGDVVRFECSAGGTRFRDLDAMLEWIGADTGDGDAMALTGPVAVAGAEPGDAVRLDILEVAPDSWGYVRTGPGLGLLADDLTEEVLIAWDLRDRIAAVPDDRSLGALGVAVPMAPFAGVIGVAPAGPARGTRAPGVFGGNLDVRKLVAGSTLWLPVEVRGALLSVGDLHAAQGSGEVGGTAIETSGEVTLRLSLEREVGLQRPRFISASAHPDGDAPALCTTGIGPDLFAASRDAVRDLVDEVVRLTGASAGHAAALCSVAADLAIEEIVDDPDWVVSCCLPLSVLGTARPEGH